ncbi:hypothetical protein [Halalkalibacter urbisdiaboli]|nr:hypothetical protein [Halalkalibacter urbisdiaboli]
MEKNQHHDDNLNSKRKAHKETLEISPTGYGFVYVENEVEEEQNFEQKE